jgi:hypothetical protein
VYLVSLGGKKKSSLGISRQGKARQGKARQGKARQGNVGYEFDAHHLQNLLISAELAVSHNPPLTLTSLLHITLDPSH